MKKSLINFILLSSILLSGCATIVGNTTQLVPISSMPSDANIVIIDETGSEIFNGTTPTTVTLPKSDGSYWGKKDFSVEISKDGYKTQTIPVKAHANGWYIAGNFFFGGLIGWFIVDPLNGAMYTLSPQNVSSDLSEELAHNNTGNEENISIVLLQDVPAHLLEKMERIN